MPDLRPTTITAERPPRPRPRPVMDRPPTEPESLTTAVESALQRLRNLALVESVIAAGDVEDRLRSALSTSRPDARGRVAARVACAHLAVGDLTDAYFALLTARDQQWEPPARALRGRSG